MNYKLWIIIGIITIPVGFGILTLFFLAIHYYIFDENRLAEKSKTPEKRPDINKQLNNTDYIKIQEKWR